MCLNLKKCTLKVKIKEVPRISSHRNRDIVQIIQMQGSDRHGSPDTKKGIQPLNGMLITLSRFIS